MQNKPCNQKTSAQMAFSYYYGIGTKKDPGKAYTLLMETPMPDDGLYHYMIGICKLCGQGTKLAPEQGLEQIKAAYRLEYKPAGLLLRTYFLAIGDIEQTRLYLES